MLLGEMSEIEKSQFLTQQRQFQKLTADIDEMEKEIESTRIQSHQERFQPRQRTSKLFLLYFTLFQITYLSVVHSIEIEISLRMIFSLIQFDRIWCRYMQIYYF